MASPEKKRRTVLIEDRPADADAFEGPHERVASAIADLIETSAQTGGKMIGLQGGWGIGKTTVARLVAKKLSDNPNCCTVWFDAWAHEGDPLRRTFLESVVEKLPDGWIPRKKWTDVCEEIAKRRKTTKTHTFTRPTTLGKCVAASAILIPIGTQFIGVALGEGVTIGGGSFAWYFWIGVLLCLAPFVAWLICGFALWLKGQSPFVLFKSRAKTVTRSKVSESPDPTSIEFERHFRNLMDDALMEEKRTLLLVLDNLDRVNPVDALRIWSTLQTFLAHRQDGDRRWPGQLWVLVPYDPDGLRKLWEKDSLRVSGAGDERNKPIDEDSRVEGNEPIDENDHDKNDEHEESTALRHSASADLPQSFIEKSFQIRFEVPPPVLSRWREYLCHRLAEALPDHDPEHYHAVYRVFNLYRARKSDAPPTPRELIVYVNQIGAIHCQWQSEFPLAHVAYYVLLRRDNVDVVAGLLAGSIPQDDMRPVLCDHVEDDLAGLAFNVEAASGMQLLFGDRIYDALSRADCEYLKQLEAANPEGFWAVAENLSLYRLPTADATDVANGATCLVKAGFAELRERRECMALISSVCHRIAFGERRVPLSQAGCQGIAAACELKCNEDYSNRIKQNVAAELKQDPKAAMLAEIVTRGILLILGKLKSIGHIDPDDNPFVLPVDANGWVTVCDELYQADHSADFWLCVRPLTAFNDVFSVLNNAIAQGSIATKHLHAIVVTSKADTSFAGSIVTAIADRLKRTESIPPNEGSILSRALCELREQGNDQAKSRLSELANEGHFLRHFHSSNENKHPVPKAMFGFCHLRELPDASPSWRAPDVASGLSSLQQLLRGKNSPIAKEFVAEIQRYDSPELLLQIADARDKYDPFIVQCLQQVADGPNFKALYTPEVIVTRWAKLQPVLDDTNEENSGFKPLLVRLERADRLFARIREREEGFEPQHAGLYRTIISLEEVETREFVVWCKDNLEGLTTQQWGAELPGGTDVVWLLLDVSKRDVDVSLGPKYADALVEHGKQILNGGCPVPENLVPQWGTLIEALRVGGTRKDLARRLLRAAMERDGDIPPCFFAMYGPTIEDAELLASTNDVVSRLFSPIVRKANVPGLQWLKRATQREKKPLRDYGNEAEVQEFENRLREHLKQSGDDEPHKLIVAIAGNLGVVKGVRP